VNDDPKAARECFTSAITGLSAAQAISRLRDSLSVQTSVPAIAGEASRLLARLARTLRHPSIRKFGKRAEEANALGRHALIAARASAQPDAIKALNGIVVGAQTLGSDLMRARMDLQEKSNAIRI
jgi:hypothetical protein